MTDRANYYRWFAVVIDFFIALFFIGSLISNLFVYVSVFHGTVKYFILGAVTAAFLTAVYLFRKPLKKLIAAILDLLSKFRFRILLLFLLLSSVLLKILAYLFFFFDSTKAGGDITIYAGLADSIVENGLSSVMDQIYYLVGMGIHLSVFRYLSIPYHVGIYLIFLLATVINFYSFSQRIGKEKSFLLIELYLLMPSTSLLSFCITRTFQSSCFFLTALLILRTRRCCCTGSCCFLRYL